MSKLEELIAEYCPNGVEYKKLKDVSIMQRGTSITKAQSKEGIYPVISGGKEPAFYCNKYNRENETITIAGSGAGAGFVQYWNEPIFVNDAFSIKGMHEVVFTRFLYYCLSNVQEQIYGAKKGEGVPHVHISDIENYYFQIPPLPVQEEIVRILDSFTQYTEDLKTKLSEELTARKKQYEYYYKAIFTMFDSPMVKLSAIGSVKMCKRILKSQTSQDGDVPFYKIGTFGSKADAYISREVYDEYIQKYSHPQKGDILISCSGTIGRTVVYNGEPAYFQDSNIVWLEHDGSKVTNEYLRYAYKMNPFIVSTGGTISRLYNDGILNAEIPLPSLDEQQKIVSILDHFDSLCNDISEGLPAEIEARQKQYEYYRDKLLSFSEII